MGHLLILWQVIITMNYLNPSPDQKLNNYFDFSSTIYKPVTSTKTNNNNILDLLKGTSNNPLIPETVNTNIVAGDLNNSKEESTESYGINDYVSTVNLDFLNAPEQPDPNNYDAVREHNLLSPQRGTEYERLRRRIGHHESGMNYNAVNRKTGKNGTAGSGAWGAYQYVWTPARAKDIKRVTGITNPQDFLKNPEAQEKYFEYQYSNWLLPGLKTVKSLFPDIQLSDTDIMQAIHFRGLNGLIKILRRGQLNTKLESNNPTVMEMLESGRKYENS